MSVIRRNAGESAEGQRAIWQRIEQGISATVAVSRVFQRAVDIQADEIRQAKRTVQRGSSARQPLTGDFLTVIIYIGGD